MNISEINQKLTRLYNRLVPKLSTRNFKIINTTN